MTGAGAFLRPPDIYDLILSRAAFGLPAGSILAVDRSRPATVGGLVIVRRPDHSVIARAVGGDAAAVEVEADDGEHHRVEPADIAGLVIAVEQPTPRDVPAALKTQMATDYLVAMRRAVILGRSLGVDLREFFRRAQNQAIEAIRAEAVRAGLSEPDVLVCEVLEQAARMKALADSDTARHA